ncbi:hypothetical protein RJ639_039583 [Escallonia herrerae]|uniref:Uncharacterized protein n=1 Tax=Escallonia herrerae TaxID=1293975 RepID=A0AA89B8H5_9ASTE|nr:hypothetical protein RJ639_039583 [Escallonia herrerae]
MKEEEATVEVGGGLFGRTRYKFWALAAILLLAMWSMLTGSVTLEWSAANLALLSGDLDSPFHDDLDILVETLPFPRSPRCPCSPLMLNHHPFKQRSGEHAPLLGHSLDYGELTEVDIVYSYGTSERRRTTKQTRENEKASVTMTASQRQVGG